jgi:hypothetical protein
MSVAQNFETMQWPQLQGSMVKQTTGPLTVDNEVTAVSKHWATNTGNRAQNPRRKGLSKLLILTFYSRTKDEIKCFICQKTKSKSKALSHAPYYT